MNRIKTQNIPTEFQAVSSNKTKSVEVSGEEFKKALQSVVGEEVPEEQTTDMTTVPETSLEDEEEVEVVYAETPWNLITPSVLSDKIAVTTNFTLEDPTQIERPQPIEQVMPEMMDAITVTTDQPIEVEEVLDQPTFILPEIEPETKAVTNKPTATQEFFTFEPTEIVSESNGKLTILENESDTQIISLVTEQDESVEPIRVENQPKVTTTESVEMPTTLDEFISQTDVEVEMETKIEPIEVQSEEFEVSERAEREVNTDISASGQLTRMKLTASQSSIQTETVKVVPQEQLVQEIETLVVENLDGTDQVEKVSTTRIQLTPKHLGELDIELVMKNNELTARLVVEKAETKQWLEQKLTQLTNTLAEQDIKIEQFEIQVSSNQASFTESSFNDNPFFKEQKQALNPRKSFHKGPEEEGVTEQVERTVQTNTGRLSIWV